jgi:DNA-directed RNA polymerase specialized sigma24 family protein
MQDENDFFTVIDLAAAIDQLPVKHRVVMALWAAGYNQRECGEIVGLSRAAIGIIRKKTALALQEAVAQ